jgi:hypothetical protein
MANVMLSWDALGNGVVDVTGIRIFRVVDQGAAPACTDFVAAGALPGDGLPAGSTQLTDITSNALTDSSYVDKSVAVGDYYYSILTYNAAGFSPCATTDKVSITA